MYNTYRNMHTDTCVQEQCTKGMSPVVGLGFDSVLFFTAYPFSSLRPPKIYVHYFYFYNKK